jgi:D-tyrosyl-tRNA(Tyr) deacylase
MPPDAAREFYEGFLRLVRSMYEPDRVKDGRFGAMMKVALVNGAPRGGAGPPRFG